MFCGQDNLLRIAQQRKISLLGLLTCSFLLTMFMLHARRAAGSVTTVIGVNHSTSESGSKQFFMPNQSIRGNLDRESFELEGPFNGTAIRIHCESIDWREGLYVDCSQNSGGLGNIRSYILTCIRYAIDGGASLVMPTIQKRNPAQLGDLFSNENLPLDSWTNAAL